MKKKISEYEEAYARTHLEFWEEETNEKDNIIYINFLYVNESNSSFCRKWQWNRKQWEHYWYKLVDRWKCVV